jgi:hypothetical protein
MAGLRGAIRGLVGQIGGEAGCTAEMNARTASRKESNVSDHRLVVEI